MMIDVISAARSEFNHCFSICQALNKLSKKVRLILTGSHGVELTENSNLIDNCGFEILNIPASLNEDCFQGKASALGNMNQAFGALWSELRPECVLFVGDRYEILAPATIATLANIPIAHAYGGECDISYCIDTRVRNALTCLSHIHFVAHDEIKKRLISLGEEPWRIHVVGNVALHKDEDDYRVAFQNHAKKMHWQENKPFIAACFLPSTSMAGATEIELEELLKAVTQFRDYNFIWAGVNSDPGSDYIRKRLNKFCQYNSNHYFSEGLGKERFFGLLQSAISMVGNSSSGFLEAASFKLPVVNVGTRQSGRLSGSNVINVDAESSLIVSALESTLTIKTQRERNLIVNPFEVEGGVLSLAESLVDFLKEDARKIMVKRYIEGNPSVVGELYRCRESI